MNNWNVDDARVAAKAALEGGDSSDHYDALRDLLDALDQQAFEREIAKIPQEVFEKLDAEFAEDPKDGIVVYTDDWRTVVQYLKGLPRENIGTIGYVEQAARAQGGQVAEPVGYVTGEARENLKKGHPVFVYAADTPLVFGSKVWLYDHANPPSGANQGGVREDLRQHIEKMLELHEKRGVVLTVHMQELEELLTTSPNKPEQEWVRCSERFPTEADGDCYGMVWIAIDGTAAVRHWSLVECASKAEIPNTHWMPTGLKRPQPPQEQREGE